MAQINLAVHFIATMNDLLNFFWQLTDLSRLLNVELVGAPSEVRMNEGHEGSHSLLDLVSRVEEDLNPAKEDNEGQHAASPNASLTSAIELSCRCNLPDLALGSERVSQRSVELSLVHDADVDSSIEHALLKSHHFI